MAPTSIKNEAKRLIDSMPDDATWDDLMHEIYVRQTIEKGLADSRAGRVSSVAEVREKYGLQP
jgi:predicted transcriptional regulator